MAAGQQAAPGGAIGTRGAGVDEGVLGPRLSRHRPGRKSKAGGGAVGGCDGPWLCGFSGLSDVYLVYVVLSCQGYTAQEWATSSPLNLQRAVFVVSCVSFRILPGRPVAGVVRGRYGSFVSSGHSKVGRGLFDALGTAAIAAVQIALGAACDFGASRTRAMSRPIARTNILLLLVRNAF